MQKWNTNCFPYNGHVLVPPTDDNGKPKSSKTEERYSLDIMLDDTENQG